VKLHRGQDTCRVADRDNSSMPGLFFTQNNSLLMQLGRVLPLLYFFYWFSTAWLILLDY
jgi:hypothetical protein